MIQNANFLTLDLECYSTYHEHSFSRGIAQSGSAPALGAGCRGFESLYPDQMSNLSQTKGARSSFG